jgi:integrase
MMSPGKTGADGCFRFDRQIKGVGRLWQSSGTKKLAEFRRRDQLLTKLIRNQQLEVLRAFKRGEITIGDLLEAERQRRLDADTLLQDLALTKPLWATIDATLPTMGKSPETRRRYHVSFVALRRRATRVLGDRAKIQDLLRADWRALRSTWLEERSPADWNNLVRALSAFLSNALGDKYHPFRRRLLKVVEKAREEDRVTDLSVAKFWALVAAAPDHVRPCYVVLAATGMRTGEYLTASPMSLLSESYGIRVKGKTGSDVVYVDPELWPWITAGVPSPVQYKWLRLYFKRAARAIGDPELRLHDLRHLFAQLAVDSGASEAMAQMALRHASPTMTRRYAKRKVRGEVARIVGGALRQRGTA